MLNIAFKPLQNIFHALPELEFLGNGQLAHKLEVAKLLFALLLNFQIFNGITWDKLKMSCLSPVQHR